MSLYGPFLLYNFSKSGGTLLIIRISELSSVISKEAVIGKESTLCDGTIDDGNGLAALVEGELLGKKNKKGFYTYDENDKQIGVNPDMVKLLPSKKITMDETTIQMRVFLPMINEAASILEENIVKDAATVDLGLIFGIGFPPFRGGLLKYADSEGLDRIKVAIDNFAESVDKDRYALSPLLQKLVDDKKKFYEL